MALTKQLREAKDRSPRWVKDTANVVTRGWGRATAGHRPLPDFVLVGTKRGGTTSLWNNLLRHPQILGMYPASRGLKSTNYFFKHHDESLKWYRSHFPTAASRQRAGSGITGEASPYYMYGPHIPRQLAEAVPSARVLVLLRDPVERAFSHYQERRAEGVEHLSFEEALAAESSRLAEDEARREQDPDYYSQSHDWFSYRDRGIYLPQVQRLQRWFPAEQLLIMRSEDFYSEYQKSFDEVTDFLGVGRHDLGRAEHHNLIKRSPMEPATRAELAAFYRPHNAALEDHLGRVFEWQLP